MSDPTHDFLAWLDRVPAVTEDHIFLPVGAQSERLTLLMNERANLLRRTPATEEGGAPEAERSLGESYTEARDGLDAQINAALEEDHPDAPRVLLRALSDEDYEQIQDEVSDFIDAMAAKNVTLTVAKRHIEAALRVVARAVETGDAPKWTPADVRLLRAKINRGEWARLLDHCNRLSDAHAEQVTDFPNS